MEKHRCACPVLSILFLLSFILVPGCTFYGQQDAIRLTRVQLDLLDEQVQDSYVRSHATLGRLENAAGNKEELRPLVDRYRHVLTVHGALVNSIEQRRKGLAESMDYRLLSRSLRAGLSGRELVNSAYESIAVELMKLSGDYQPSNPFASDAESILIPPYYRARQSSIDRHTVVDGLRILNY